MNNIVYILYALYILQSCDFVPNVLSFALFADDRMGSGNLQGVNVLVRNVVSPPRRFYFLNFVGNIVKILEFLNF